MQMRPLFVEMSSASLRLWRQAVVPKPVQAYALVAANPAEQIDWEVNIGIVLNFDDDGIAICRKQAEIHLSGWHGKQRH